ncbi:sugar transferase [Candidatus Contubernalis alkaliaceticus]|uniref:sugar transferase n=1 Tax=Candidatus Contubernalis alkaliaceticus TaxID=338645 RepID=UPI001F4BFC7D|nr:sugar transferase [Candidatus Contubernalis alkalaceticus]UNC93618.1 sugar transferase [Candidatus Contubernalis alkalaceticus]
MKRLFDFLVSFILIILFSPVLMVTALLIYRRMGSPVLFKQVRPGLRGRAFTLYKFRTMEDKRDKEGKLLSDEERLTPLGQNIRRFSLDELPQLFNVLKGDMSLVGPRPLLMSYLRRYTGEQARRHEVKPGITGWAQVNGRNAITWEDKFALDVWYVNNQTFWLDLKILWKTLIKVLRSEGISQEGFATMPEFKGSDKDQSTGL